MKQIILLFLLSIGIGSIGYCDSVPYHKEQQRIQPLKQTEIRHMDRKLTKHKAIRKKFKTKKEYLRRKNKKMYTHSTTFDRRYPYYNNGYRDRHLSTRQRGYRDSKRGWRLVYRYDRASFYDNNGYYYGYFNKEGFYFENIFYRYDRYYTYRDRVRGRGLFDHRYYMPINARHYGFCS